MAKTFDYDDAIPAGYRIFSEFEIAGVQYRRDELKQVIRRGKGFRLFLEPDPKNKHDPFAVKVMARYTVWWILPLVVQIGYVPAAKARRVSEAKCFDDFQLRRRSLWIGDMKGIAFTVQILGPKESYKDFQKGA